MQALVDDALGSIEYNDIGSRLYLQHYSEYQYLLDGSANKSLEEFLETDPAPLLRDFGLRIQGYDELRDKVWGFRDKVRGLNTQRVLLLLLLTLYTTDSYVSDSSQYGTARL